MVTSTHSAALGNLLPPDKLNLRAQALRDMMREDRPWR